MINAACLAFGKAIILGEVKPVAFIFRKFWKAVYMEYN